MEKLSAQSITPAPVFRRALPGGGFVVIGIEQRASDRLARTTVWVERGDSTERKKTDPDLTVIGSVDGDERSSAFTEMYRLAADNAAIARGLMRSKATQSNESPLAE